MVLLQVTTGGTYALPLAVIVAVIYLAVVRFMDRNEKEPLWAVGLLFILGVVVSLRAGQA
jgi:RsiW-degrading membrane proteinase PrsW (M82 family)